MNAFLNIQLQPAYGAGQVGVTWKLNSKFEHGVVFVYRSVNGGLPPWDLRNTNAEGIPGSVGYFVDLAGDMRQSTFSMPHYRLAVQLPDGTIYDSPVINPLGKLTKKELNILTNIMWQEYRFLRSGNGVPVFVFAPKLTGIPTAGFDVVSDQLNSKGDDSEGRPFISGYTTPALTWMHRIFSPQTIQQGLKVDGFDNAASQVIKARMLAFPRPAPGYMIAQPDTDERYEINQIIAPLMFKGVAPIGYEVDLLPISRSSAEYELPLPAVPAEMYTTFI